MLARADVTTRIRNFFDSRGALEVATPALEPHAVHDARIRSIRAGDAHFLHTSPEYAMKRLLAEHRRDIYQLARVFRDDPEGPRHLREFTMLEWYRVGGDCESLMSETAKLLHELLSPYISLDDDKRIAWRELFGSPKDDPARASDAELIARCESGGFVGCRTRGEALDFLTSAALRELPSRALSFVCDYPPEMAQLARVRDGVAERFEAYLGDLELVNGCTELTDPAECKRRCEAQNEERAREGRDPVTPTRLYEAMEAPEAKGTGETGETGEAGETGLPECAGAALGFDRLLAAALGLSVREV